MLQNTATMFYNGNRRNMENKIKTRRARGTPVCVRLARTGRPEEQSGMHVKFNETIAELSQLALTHVELPTLMNTAVAVLAEMLSSEMTGVLKHRTETHDFIPVAVCGLRSKEARQVIVPDGRNSQTGTALATHVPVIVKNWRAEKRFKTKSRMLQWGIVSGITLAINGKYRPYGVLAVDWNTTHTFTQQEVNFLKSVANVLAYCAARDETEEEMKKQSEQLRAFAARLLEIREETTTRISREIHDELGQALTGLKFDLIALNKTNNARTRLFKTLAMSKTIDRSIGTVRRLSSELRPAVLDDLGICSAIEWQLREFQTKTNIRIKVKGMPESIPMDKKQETSLFRIFQEALTNVARHAQAKLVRVTMRMEGGKLLLEIKDDGVGARAEQVSDTKSFGLLGMKERALDAGGTVTVLGKEGKGTTVTVQMPLELLLKEKHD